MSTGNFNEQQANRYASGIEALAREADEREQRKEKAKNPRDMKLAEWEKEFLNAQSESLSWEEFKEKVLNEAYRREKELEQREKESPYLKSPVTDIEYMENHADSYSTPEQLQRAVQRLIAYALKFKTDFHDNWESDKDNPKASNDPTEKKRKYDITIEEISRLMTVVDKSKDLQGADAQQLRAEMRKLAGFIKNSFSSGREFELGPFKNPKSMKELGRLIMEGTDEKFTEKGDFPIVDKEGEFHPENFEAWIREELVDLATNISPNDPFNAFSEIHAQTPFKTITFLNMYRNLSYWREEEIVEDIASQEDEESKVKDMYGKTVKEGQIFQRKTYKKSEEYENLRNHIANQLFMFGYLHEFDVDLRLNKGGEENVPKIIAKHSSKNTLTEKRSRMLFLLKLNSTQVRKTADGKVIKELDEVLANEEMLNVGTVGNALRRSMLAYYYLGEISSKQSDNMFEKILGEEGTDEFYRGIIRHIIKDKGIKEAKEKVARMKNQPTAQQGAQRTLDVLLKATDEKEREKQGKSKEWLDDVLTNYRNELALLFQFIDISDAETSDFDRNTLSWKAHAAKLLQKEWRMGGDGSYKTLEVLNLFSQRNAEAQNIKILRDAMTEALMKTEKLEKHDASYAELMANDMWYTMGMSARNDLNGRAFDAWSKTTDFKRYRIKQGDQRLYPGNVYNMFGIKRIGFTPLEAWDVKRKDGTRTNLLEQLQGGEGSDISGFNDFGDFDFEGDAQGHYASDHVGNGYRLYHWLLEEDLDWADLFTWEKGVLKFKMKAANDIMDDKYHTIRYTYDNISPHYEKKIRSAEYVWDPADKKYKVQFVDETLLESAFDKEVREMGMYNRPDLLPDKGKNVARDVFGYLISKEIYAHTKWDSPKEKWTDEHIGLLFGFLRKMTVGGFYQDEKGNVKQVSKFFDWNELGKIRSVAKRGFWYEIRTVSGQILLLPIDILFGITGAHLKNVLPKELGIEIKGLEIGWLPGATVG